MGVYGPHLDADKVAFMEELCEIRDLHAGPWSIVGDFNLILNPEDKNNQAINRRIMSRFRSMLNRLELKEVYLNGRRYTWSNERQLATLEKIDHVLSTNEWDDLHPLAFWEPWDRPFQAAWGSFPSTGNPYVVLHHKLGAMAKALQRWSDKWIGNVNLQVGVAMELIYRLDLASESRTLSVEEENIAEMVDDYYGNLLGTPTQRVHTLNLDALDLPTLDLSHLELPFTTEEVEQTVKCMPLDKAPGPDGFTGRFYATCWGVIKEDIMRAFHTFYLGDMRGLQVINKALISLLPKVDGAVDNKDFRPEGSWPLDITNLDLDELREYVNLWHRMAIIQQQPDSPDMLSWACESNGAFSMLDLRQAGSERTTAPGFMSVLQSE
ncbi:uncharacterized protein [Aegilops tauschii subsp. strangulata]|uniref:uncharacterized protein n=1 Tax=Aegilops tauschii subsp. strangulata TaxID=200361 RepID=UPI003CC83E5D